MEEVCWLGRIHKGKVCLLYVFVEIRILQCLFSSLGFMLLQYLLTEASICVSHLQKSFHPAARMLRASSIEAMRKYQGKTRLPQPFIFTVGKVNINNYLGSIEEIPELCLPYC